VNIDFSIEEAVRKRYSVRNYTGGEIEDETKNLIHTFIQSLDNPFGRKVHFHHLDNKDIKNQKNLGTYGVIKGAKQYIGSSIKKGPMALEALGYEFEAVVIFLAHLGIGTCWLGGTFNRKEFSKIMKIGEDELFPIITPYGYPAAKKHTVEVAMRKMIKADQRKNWEELFYHNDFQAPLTKEEAGDLVFPLEMVRLGPSASNKQPWRIVVDSEGCHFYEYKEPKYSEKFSYDIQRIDMGIAAAHFDFSVKEKGMEGYFDTTSQPEVLLPEHVEYVFSWIRK
jgi:nitroreductase